jgi:fibronectin type 3 domain-containing protein
VEDIFPPDAPTGLVSAPGFAAGGGVVTSGAPVIDLSWEPNMGARVVGYRVYRREGEGPWRALGGELVRVAAYRDTTVAPGKTYAYRVTALDAGGHESGASSEVVETAPDAPPAR